MAEEEQQGFAEFAAAEAPPRAQVRAQPRAQVRARSPARVAVAVAARPAAKPGVTRSRKPAPTVMGSQAVAAAAARGVRAPHAAAKRHLKAYKPGEKVNIPKVARARCKDKNTGLVNENCVKEEIRGLLRQIGQEANDADIERVMSAPRVKREKGAKMEPYERALRRAAIASLRLSDEVDPTTHRRKFRKMELTEQEIAEETRRLVEAGWEQKEPRRKPVIINRPAYASSIARGMAMSEFRVTEAEVRQGKINPKTGEPYRVGQFKPLTESEKVEMRERAADLLEQIIADPRLAEKRSSPKKSAKKSSPRRSPARVTSPRRTPK